MIKIYSNPDVNMFYIEGVAEGSVDAFTAQQSGDYISIWRNGLQIYEIQNVHYSQLADNNNTGFASAASAMGYVNGLLAVTPKSFVHNFSDSTDITITHNMGKQYPSFRVEDTAGTWWIPPDGAVSYINANTMQISFTVLFSGKVILN